MTQTNVPAAQSDVSRPATEAEKLAVLACLFAAYPSRAPNDFKLVRRAYLMALENVSQWGLFEAERRINQGALGHGFLPSPSELRREIDRVMEPFRERERRAAEEKRRYLWAEDDKPRARALPAPQGDPEAVAKWRVRRAAQKAEAAVKSARGPIDQALFADKDQRAQRTLADAVADFITRQDRRQNSSLAENVGDPDDPEPTDASRQVPDCGGR